VKTIEKLQTWLADHFKGFQYPNINQVKHRPEWEAQHGSLFIEVDKNSNQARVGIEGKIILFCFSIVLLAASIVIFCFGLFWLYVVIHAMFT
jgi:hypothetical protein